MPWSLTRFDPENPEILSRYFQAIGKLLAIANNFEKKAAHVLGAVLQVEAFEENVSFVESGKAYSKAFDLNLANAINQLNGKKGFSESDIEALHSGRESRNYLAHEGPEIFDPTNTPYSYVYERVLVLEPHVRAVAAADKLVSSWSYEIQEKEHAPIFFKTTYVERVMNWVFEDLLDEAREFMSIHDQHDSSA